MSMKRRQFVLARDERPSERYGLDGYPLRFFAGRRASGRISTTHDLQRGVAFYYDSPLLRRTEEELNPKGFRVHEILVVNPETRTP